MSEKPQTDELPKLNAYNKNVFWSISWSHLLADLSLIVYSFFFSRYFVNHTDVGETISPLVLLFLYVIVVFSLPWFLGYMYVVYAVFYSSFIKQIVKWIFIVITLFTLVYLIGVMSHVYPSGNDPSSNLDSIGFFILFLLVLGPMMGLGGLAAGYGEFRTDKLKDEASVTTVLISIVIAIALLVWACQKIDLSSRNIFLQYLLMFLIFIGASLGAALFIGLMMLIKTGLEKINAYDKLSLLAQNLFPFFIVSTLVIWNEVGLRLIVDTFGDTHEKISLTLLLISLTFTGLIPFRIIMLFAPPLKAINIFIGLVAFTFYICNVLQLVG